MIFLICLAILPFVFHADPVPGLRHSTPSARNLDCEPVGAAEGKAERPGPVETTKPRGDGIEGADVICTKPLVNSIDAP